MAVYDVLRSKGGPAGALQFAVNTAATEVATGGLAAGIQFDNAAGFEWFEPGDNLVIQGAWIETPHGFRQGTGVAILPLIWEEGGGAQSQMLELASGGGIMMPSFCGLMFPDPNAIFVANPNNGNRQAVVLQDTTFNVSMANVPALLDGLTLTAAVFLLVRHTLPMAGVP